MFQADPSFVDNVIVAFEIDHATKNKYGGILGDVALKLMLPKLLIELTRITCNR